MHKNKLFNLIFSFILLLCFNNKVNSQENSFFFNFIFNDHLSESEKEVLSSGNILIRNTHKASNMVINPADENLSLIINKIHSLKPSYLSEIIQVIPVNSNPNLIQKLLNALCDIPSYKGIPYYSEYNKIWVDLYSKAEISLEESKSQEKFINADFYMKPFGDFSSSIHILHDENSILYTNSNSTDIIYHDIACVKTNKMLSLIYVFKSEDYWILYGIGGVHAPKVPFLSERIELSFMNRIKTFCNFIFTKII